MIAGETPVPQLKCVARLVEGDRWEATFSGYCNRKFAYEVKMDGEQVGDKIVFVGQANLGEKDGHYKWTGEIVGTSFLSRYSSEKGKKGKFKMQRMQRAKPQSKERK